ncbi:MAG: hypothetical protein L6R39_007018 [Caloplaca ligustica]|nr:MAG: hypothetical protein L6R39_007018 [Caloplaca ligustica]
MSKKRRQREGYPATHGPPPKRRAIGPSVRENSGVTVSKVPISANGIRITGPVDRNAAGPSGLAIDDLDAEEKSGYQSLDLLEQILLDPPRARTPSSLPLPTATEAARTGTDLLHGTRELPDLPVIQDTTVAFAPFTHQGVLKDTTTTDRGTSNLNYERLEFLGDAYLELIASRIILPRFPDFDPGKLSQTRQLLVCNETLADFSQRYDFHKRARLPPEIRRKEDSQDKGWIKVMGDIFEAYVAALIISEPESGFATAEQWLAELWEPLLLTQVNPDVADAKAKQVLATKVMTKGTKINYRDAAPPEKSKAAKGQIVFRIKVYYTGLGYKDVCLGSGKGPNKAEAGYDAAANALKHPKLKEIMAAKKEFDMQAKATREQQMAAQQTTDE